MANINKTIHETYYWMRHGQSCANVVKNICTRKDRKNEDCDKVFNLYRGSYTQVQSLKHNIVDFAAKRINKFKHTLIANPNISGNGVEQCININTTINTKINNNAEYKQLTDTIVFCSTLVRAIQTAIISSNKTNIFFLNLDEPTDKIISLIKDNYKTSIFVIPYIKEKGDTVDNLASSYEETINRLSMFFSKLPKSYTNNENITYNNVNNDNNIAGIDDYFNKYKNEISITQFKNKIEIPIINELLSDPNLKLNPQLPLYIVSHVGFIVTQAFNLKKDKGKKYGNMGGYLNNCEIISNDRIGGNFIPDFKQSIRGIKDYTTDEYCIAESYKKIIFI